MNATDKKWIICAGAGSYDTKSALRKAGLGNDNIIDVGNIDVLLEEVKELTTIASNLLVITESELVRASRQCGDPVIQHEEVTERVKQIYPTAEVYLLPTSFSDFEECISRVKDFLK